MSLDEIRDSPAKSRNDRLGWVDGLRGAAIVLMVLDHVLVQADPDSFLRYSLTRLSLPAFMFAAAVVWRPLSWRRFASLTVAAVVEVLVSPPGMPVPGIVAVILLVLLFIELLRWASPRILELPGVLGVLGLLGALYQPWSGDIDGWTGYEPGLVLAWWALGRLAAHELEPLAVRSPRWLRAIGRRPLWWYVGHLAAIYAVLLLV